MCARAGRDAPFVETAPLISIMASAGWPEWIIVYCCFDLRPRICIAAHGFAAVLLACAAIACRYCYAEIVMRFDFIESE